MEDLMVGFRIGLEGDLLREQSCTRYSRERASRHLERRSAPCRPRRCPGC